MATTDASDFLAQLRGHVDAWYADRIDFETFRTLQRKTWDSIRAAGARVEERVLRGIREQLPQRSGR